MQNVTREQQKAEAVERMKMLNLMGASREAFKRSNKVQKSEPMSLGGAKFGILYDADEKLKQEIADFEAEHNALVYHVIRSYTEFGTWDSYLYVSNYPDEWESDRADIKDGYVLAYVNTGDFCSEIGTIGVREAGGGLLRIA